jgi:hypothetical protein
MRRYLCLVPVVLLLLSWPTDAGAQADKENPQSVRGTIGEVRPNSSQFMLQTRDGKQLWMQIDKNSRLRFDGQPAELKRFQEGMTVRVSYAPRAGTNYVLVLTHGPVSALQVKNEVNEALRSVKEYTFQQKDEYVRQLQGVLGQLNDQIEDLQERAAQSSGENKERLEQAAKDLRAREQVVRDRLQRARSASAEAWQELRSGVHTALEELRDAVDKAAARFK